VRRAIALALILMAFLLGMLAERRLHGAGRARALDEVERAIHRYDSATPPRAETSR
jgi:hypothetical protein